jgi:DNA anti-recombination protein RmuC
MSISGSREIRELKSIIDKNCTIVLTLFKQIQELQEENVKLRQQIKQLTNVEEGRENVKLC